MIRINRTADQVISVIQSKVSPVGETGLRRKLRACGRRLRNLKKGAIRHVFEVAVGGGGYSVAVGIDAREDGNDVVRGVRDERRVVVAEEHAVVLEEVEQVGHLLKVGGYQR